MMDDSLFSKTGEQRRADAMAWYDNLVRGATASLSKMFDPNYGAVRGATIQSPYSDSRGMSLQEMFQQTRPLLHNTNQIPPTYENGWVINRVPHLPVQKKPYQGML